MPDANIILVSGVFFEKFLFFSKKLLTNSEKIGIILKVG